MQPRKCSLALAIILAFSPVFTQAVTYELNQADITTAIQKRNEWKHAEAAAVFKQWLKTYPDDGRVHFELAYALYLQAAAETNPAVASPLRKEAHAHLVRSRDCGHKDAMLDALLAEIDENGNIHEPKQYAPDPETSALIAKGEQSFSQGKIDDARVLYTQAFERDPKAFIAALYIGDVHYYQKRYSESIEWFKRAAEINPDLETAHRYWADALRRLDRHDEALAKYIDALIANPYARFPRSMLQKIAEARGRPIRPSPINELSMAGVRLGPGKQIILGINPESQYPGELLYAMARAAWLTGESEKYFAADATPRHSLPEETEGLRKFSVMIGELIENKSEDMGKWRPAADAITTLDKSGLLESFILIDRADEGIVQDYRAYRREHRDNLVRYIREYWLDEKPVAE